MMRKSIALIVCMLFVGSAFVPFAGLAKEINPEIPVIAQTAYALPDDEKKFKKGNFDDYIGKPFIQNKLLNIISNHI